MMLLAPRAIEACGCASEIRLAEFQEGRLDHMIAGSRHFHHHLAHGFICALNARSVSEDDESGHTLNLDERGCGSGAWLGLREVGAQIVEEGAAARAPVILVQLHAFQKYEGAQDFGVTNRRRVLFRQIFAQRFHRFLHALVNSSGNQVGGPRFVIQPALQRAISAYQGLQRFAHVRIHDPGRGQAKLRAAESLETSAGVRVRAGIARSPECRGWEPRRIKRIGLLVRRASARYGQSSGQLMVTSRSLPQHSEQISPPTPGQWRRGFARVADFAFHGGRVITFLS